MLCIFAKQNGAAETACINDKAGTRIHSCYPIVRGIWTEYIVKLNYLK